MLNPITSAKVYILGDLLALKQDPLGFLTSCMQRGQRTVNLRFFNRSGIMLCQPDDIEHVFVADAAFYNKPIWLKSGPVRRLLGNGMVSADGDEWRKQRRDAAPGFQPHRIFTLIGPMSEIITKAVSPWKVGQVIDLSREMSQLTMRIVVQTLFGTIDQDETHDLSNAFDTLMTRFAAPESMLGLRALVLPTMPSAAERKAGIILRRLARRLIDESKSEVVPRPLMHSMAKASPAALTPTDIVDHVLTFISAGHESSALVLSWLWLLLSQSPRYYDEVCHEVHSVVGSEQPGEQHFNAMPKTKAALMETMRLFPPLWITGREARETRQIDGRTVNRGDQVIASPWAMHRSPQYFANPNEFVPERWTDEFESTLPRFAYFPFGGGPRICIGMGFAYTEMLSIVCHILQRVRPEVVLDKTLKPVASMTLRPSVPIRAKLTPRSQVFH